MTTQVRDSMTCPTCHGEGGRYGPGYIPHTATPGNPKGSYSDDGMWEPCPSCNGATWIPVWPEELGDEW